MTERQIETYEGVLKVLPERNMRQAINGSYNPERFELFLRIRCGSDIGEMTIENDLDPLLRELPEDTYPLSDTEKVGAYVRETENDAFTLKGYCYHASDQWQEAYDRKQSPKQVELYQSRPPLYLVPKGTEPGDLSVGAWLGFPYNEASKIQVLENPGLRSFKYRRIAEVHIAAPLFKQLTGRDNGIDWWNDFARKPSSMTRKELLEYKAVAEHERHSSSKQAAELADRLDQYMFDPCLLYTSLSP